MYTYEGAEFILEPISDSVVRVTYREQTGHYGLPVDWDPNDPYTQTRVEGLVRDDSIGYGISGFTYSSLEAALNELCKSMPDDQRTADARRINPEERKAVARRVMRELLEEIPALSIEDPPVPSLSSNQTADEGPPANDEKAMEEPMDGEEAVTVRLEDLCRIADAMSTIVHDLDNGKWKYVEIELDTIHEVVEKWASDESLLGGGYHEHRCRRCRQFGRLWRLV